MLLRRLRRVAVGADRHVVREALVGRGAARRDEVREVGVLEDELVELRPAHHPVVIQVDRVELVRAVAPVVGGVEPRRAVRLRVVVVSVAHRQVMRRVEVRGRLRRHEVLAIRNGEDAVLVGEEAGRVDDLRRVLLRPFDGAEEVRPVLRDRAAEAAAELVAAVVLLARVRQDLALRLRVHRLVAEHLEEAARRRVGAGLGDDVQHAAVAAAVLRLEALRLEVELLDRFEREHLQQAADGVVVVVAAVDLIVDVAAVAAVYLRRVLRALGRVGVEAEADAGNRRREVRELAAVQRQRLDALRIDDGTDRRGGDLDQRRRTGDVHGLSDRRDLQREVDRLRLTDVDVNGLPRHRREALELRRDVVDSDGQRVQAVDAFGVADFRARKAGCRASRGNGHAGNGRALRIENPSRDVAGRLLCVRGDSAEQHRERCPE